MLLFLAFSFASCCRARAANACTHSRGGSYNCTLPGLESMTPGKYQGVVGNYMSFATQTSSPHFSIRAKEFEACTGGTITFSEANNVFEDPIADLGTRQQEGQGIFDAYLMSYSHFPEASALGLAETLNDRIRSSAAQLHWEDVFPQVQKMGQYRKGGQNNLDFLMFDGDFFVPIVRLDLLEKHRVPLPNTWHETVEIARFFHGRDLNDDGTPDFGLCHFPRVDGDFWDWWWPELLYSTWATFAQTHSDQGFFFDDHTFEPKIDTLGFRQAAQIWKQLWKYGDEGCISPNMATGRCAVGFSPPGCWKGIFLDGIKRVDANGTVVWRPTMANGQYAEPYRLNPFGTLEVVDPATGRLASCTTRLCPKANPIPARGPNGIDDRTRVLPPSPLQGQLINRAPFFWSGGLGTLIRKSALPQAKDMMWDFFVYINSPTTSAKDVAAYSSWIDSWRYSQLTQAGTNFVVESTWSRDAYMEHREVMTRSLGRDSNAALNLRIPGIKEYTHNVLATSMAEFISGNITEDQLVAKVKRGWIEVSENRGIIDQLQTYRAALSLEALSESQLCDLHRRAMDADDVRTCRKYDPPADGKLGTILIAAGSTIGSFFILAFFGWVAYTVRSRMRLLAERARRMQQVVTDALDTVGTLKYPMVLLDANSYLSLGSLIPHEVARDRQDLVLKCVDSCGDLERFLASMYIIFLSHQWLSWYAPDPHQVQYTCSCRAIKALIKDKGWDAANTYIWCDYVSIPQQCRAIQTLAIISLPVYSSKVNAFMVVAPKAMHEETQVECCLKTYSARAWCRAEVLSHALCKGIANMYVANEAGLIPFMQESSTVSDSIHVFQGNLTCCHQKHVGTEVCDREKLVVPFLGLYSYVIHALKWNSAELTSGMKEFFENIVANKHQIFPASFEHVSAGGVEKRKLFGGLLELMESEVANNTSNARFEDFRQRGTVVMASGRQRSMHSNVDSTGSMDLTVMYSSTGDDAKSSGVRKLITNGSNPVRQVGSTGSAGAAAAPLEVAQEDPERDPELGSVAAMPTSLPVQKADVAVHTKADGSRVIKMKL